MNSLTKTIRGVQRGLSVLENPYHITAEFIVGRMPMANDLPKPFAPKPKTLAKGARRKDKK